MPTGGVVGLLYNRLSRYCKWKSRCFCSYFRRLSLCDNPILCCGHSGGILIEFAFSIPILIIILLFASDHYRFYELKNKLRGSAYLAASMVQQLNNAKTNKQITSFDLARISFASCLNLFYNNSMFDPFPIGMYYDIDYYYVKRINSDSYNFQVCYGSTSIGHSPNEMSKTCGVVTVKTLAEIQEYDPNLACEKDGDEKLLLECCYRKRKLGLFNINHLGFFLLNPKTTTTRAGSSNNFLVYHLIIVPKPGLFPGRNE